MSEAMNAEFDTVAEWTAEAAQTLGEEFFLPAACRGSGSPAALDWLIGALELSQGDVLLDCGAGVGGPARYAVQKRQVHALLAEPEAGACRAAARLFALPVVQSSGSVLPIADHSVDAAWSLGVLCTMQDQLGLLTELRRVVRPPGRIGLIVYVATTHIPEEEQPDGNRFPTFAALEKLFHDAHLTVVEQRPASELDATPSDWQRRGDDVEAEIARRHGEQKAWKLAEQQSALMGDLIGEGKVQATLFSVRHSRDRTGRAG
jgi:cyclopropane fatty-acyl-phospholipid synthase-like methyltransferase